MINVPLLVRTSCGCVNTGFMVHWLRSVVQGQIDMAVINAYNGIGAFFYVWCQDESGGVVTDRGWSCIFEDMPHLCPFSEEKVKSFSADASPVIFDGRRPYRRN